MANSKKKSSTAKQLPALIFLIGVFLIVSGIMMQLGLIGPRQEEIPTPSEVVDNNSSTDDTSSDDQDTDGTAQVTPVEDFTNTTIVDNEEIKIIQTNEYSYANDAFKMVVNELVSTCDETGVCGGSTDILKVTFTDGTNQYPLTFTPAQPSALLIDVPIEVTSWEDGYVNLKTTRQ